MFLSCWRSSNVCLINKDRRIYATSHDFQRLSQLSLWKDKFMQSKNLQTYFQNNQNLSPFYARKAKSYKSKDCSSFKYFSSFKNIVVYSSSSQIIVSTSVICITSPLFQHYVSGERRDRILFFTYFSTPLLNNKKLETSLTFLAKRIYL